MVKFLRYHNTNCYFIESSMDDSLLAIDAGWPCTLYEYQRNMKLIGLSFKNIKWAIATHFHLDHAGLMGEFIKAGICCYLLENQTLGKIDEMEETILRNRECSAYQRIDRQRLVSIGVEELNNELARWGIGGELLVTRGHTPDSVSYITKNREAIVGDLTPANQTMESDSESLESWAALRSKGVKTIYPSHAEIFEI